MKTNTDVLAILQDYINWYHGVFPGIAQYAVAPSASATVPQTPGSDCQGYYGDSAQLLNVSALMEAMSIFG